MPDLKRYNTVPPGGFPFIQEEGIYKRWEFSVDLNARANEISDFRKGNNLPRASFDESLEDLVAYTCARVPNWCRTTDRTFTETSPIIVRRHRGCAGCGARIP